MYVDEVLKDVFSIGQDKIPVLKKFCSCIYTQISSRKYFIKKDKILCIKYKNYLWRESTWKKENTVDKSSEKL